MRTFKEFLMETAMTPFEAGKRAFHAGKTEADNPYISGTTKLGAPKLSDYEAGTAWQAGFQSAKPGRWATKKEREAAAAVDVSRFRRKRNSYYNS